MTSVLYTDLAPVANDVPTVMVVLPGWGSTALTIPVEAFASVRGQGVDVFVVQYRVSTSMAAMATDAWLQTKELVTVRYASSAAVGVRIVLLGYSMGGFVVQHMLRQHPRIASGVVFVATSCARAGFMPVGMRMMMRLLFAGRRRGSRVLELLFPAEYLQTLTALELDQLRSRPHVDRDTNRAQLRAIVRYVLGDRYACRRLADITVPVCILQGGEDAIIPASSAARLQRSLRPGVPCHTVVLPGVGHGIMFQATEDVSVLLGAWYHAHFGPEV